MTCCATCNPLVKYARRKNRAVTGGILPTFVTSSDVKAKKDQINAQVDSLSAFVSTCANVPDALGQSWADWMTSWDGFYTQSEGFWTAGSEMNQAENYQQELSNYQDEFAKVSCATGPNVIPTSGGTPVGPHAPEDQSQSTLKWIIGGAVALVLLIALGKVV
jgi:hypothetical protein